MNGITLTQYYNLHGIHLAISCEPGLASALHSRLKHFATENSDSPDVIFEYSAVPGGGNHIIERPQGPTRSVYDLPLGEVLYAEDKEQFYINYAEQVRVLCDAARGQVIISAPEREQNNLWLLSHPLFTFPLIESMKRRAYYALHAAALALDGKGILLAGTTGAGKSTLTLALLKAGFDFLGDDLVFLRQTPSGLRALAFPEEIDVTEETIRLFPELAPLLNLPQPHGWRKRQVSAATIYNANIVMQAHPTILIFPRVADANKSNLKPLTAEEAFLELVPNVMLTQARSSQAHLDVLANLAKQCACYRLGTGRDLDSLSLTLRQLIELQGA